MPSEREFAKHAITLEIVCEAGELPTLDDAEFLARAIENQEVSANVNDWSSQKISPLKAVEILLDHGYEPDFLGLTYEGEDVP